MMKSKITINRKLFALAILVIIIISTGMKTFYIVNTDEAAMVLRFGKWDKQYVEAGLHFKIPYIDAVYKAPIKRVLKEEFGFRTLKAGVKTVYSNQQFDDESLTLTGDLNVADLEWIVQYQIKDPYKALDWWAVHLTKALEGQRYL